MLAPVHGTDLDQRQLAGAQDGTDLDGRLNAWAAAAGFQRAAPTEWVLAADVVRAAREATGADEADNYFNAALLRALRPQLQIHSIDVNSPAFSQHPHKARESSSQQR